VTEAQVPRPRSTKIYHSFWPRQSWRAAELLEQARGRISGRYAPRL
jgi:hypothetical protein